MFTHHHIREGLKMLKRRVFFSGFKRFKGDAQTICKTIVGRCFNGTYFQTSLGHFDLFYMRDFAFCIEALLKLGFEKEVVKTLEYALHCFGTSGKVATTISKKDIPFDVFNYAVDSLPLLFHCLFVLEKFQKGKGKELVEVYRPWLQIEVDRFFTLVVDDTTGLVRADRFFSSMKDHAKRSVSCYDVSMCGMLSSHLDFFGFLNPLHRFNYSSLLKKHFWKEHHFVDALGSDVVSGDANVYPYWYGVIVDKKMLRESITAIQRLGLDEPFPLKYTIDSGSEVIFPLSLFASNYEGNSIWMHLGLCYLDVVASVDKKLLKKYLKMYSAEIEKHGTFVEVFTSDGSVYRTPFYIADESMLWAGKFASFVEE